MGYAYSDNDFTNNLRTNDDLIRRSFLIRQLYFLPKDFSVDGILSNFKDNNRLNNAKFIDAPAGTGYFSVLTDRPNRDYFSLGDSMAVTLPEGRSAYFTL